VPRAGADELTPVDPSDPRFPATIERPASFIDDPAWLAYDRAFADAASGELARARSELRALAARWPGHPAARRAAALVASPARGRARQRAGGELVLWSTVNGVIFGNGLCEALGCTSTRARGAATIASVGGALGLSLLAARRGVLEGEAQLYNSAQAWGWWNALGLNDGVASERGEALAAIGAQAGGLLAGIAIWRAWRPSAGQVALTNTCLLWGTVLTFWGHAAAGRVPELRTIVIASDAALAVGAVAARALPDVSRGRTLLIDVGGLLGTLVGALAATGGDSESRTVGAALLSGTAVGLGLAVGLSRRWDAPPPVQVSPAVVAGPGGGVGYGAAAVATF
jgi:hypothetical protein